MPSMVPRKIFFVKGVGTHRSQLGSFENALRDADIAKYNLVEVSSIFPPYAEMVDREEGLKLLKPGQILHLVLARNSSNELNRLIAASVGFAIPRNRNMYGYLSEHHSFGETSEVAGKFGSEFRIYEKESSHARYLMTFGSISLARDLAAKVRIAQSVRKTFVQACFLEKKREILFLEIKWNRL